MDDQASKGRSAQPETEQETPTESEEQQQHITPDWRSGIGRGKYQAPKPQYKLYESVYLRGVRSLNEWTVQKVHSDCTYDLKDASGKSKANVKEDDIDPV